MSDLEIFAANGGVEFVLSLAVCIPLAWLVISCIRDLEDDTDERI